MTRSGFCLPVKWPKWRWAVDLVCLGTLAAWQAHGAKEENLFRLVWVRGANAGSCAGQLELEQQVSSRLGRDPFDIDGNRIINVRVSSDGNLWHVAITLEDHLGTLL